MHRCACDSHLAKKWVESVIIVTDFDLQGVSFRKISGSLVFFPGTSCRMKHRYNPDRAGFLANPINN